MDELSEISVAAADAEKLKIEPENTAPSCIYCCDNLMLQTSA
jgi:hypothetical protein